MGLVPAQYPPMMECKARIATKIVYFPVGRGVGFDMMVRGGFGFGRVEVGGRGSERMRFVGTEVGVI